MPVAAQDLRSRICIRVVRNGQRTCKGNNIFSKAAVYLHLRKNVTMISFNMLYRRSWNDFELDLSDLNLGGDGRQDIILRLTSASYHLFPCSFK